MLIKFDVYKDGDYWCARGIDADIFTQGKTLDELLENLKEAVLLHFEDQPVTVFLLSSMEVSRSGVKVASY